MATISDIASYDIVEAGASVQVNEAALTITVQDNTPIDIVNVQVPAAVSVIEVVTAGPQGPPGPAGTGGGGSANTVLYGSGAPVDTTGNNGDFYIDTSVHWIYGPKSTTWPAGTSMIGPQGDIGPTGPQGIQGVDGQAGPTGPTGPQGIQGVKGDTGAQGPAGADGNTVLYGTVDPTTEGVDGNFYINTSTHFIFGPRAAGAWPAGTSLVGPQGPQGATGPTGATGPQGIQGNTGAQGPMGPVAPSSFSRSGTLAVVTGNARWYAAGTLNIARVRASVGTSPAGSSVIIDVKKNGTTIFTTTANRPTIAAGGNMATGVPDVTSLAAGDFLTVDIVQIGSTTAGSDLTVQIEFA